MVKIQKSGFYIKLFTTCFPKLPARIRQNEISPVYLKYTGKGRNYLRVVSSIRGEDGTDTDTETILGLFPTPRFYSFRSKIQSRSNPYYSTGDLEHTQEANPGVKLNLGERKSDKTSASKKKIL